MRNRREKNCRLLRQRIQARRRRRGSRKSEYDPGTWYDLITMPDYMAGFREVRITKPADPELADFDGTTFEFDINASDPQTLHMFRRNLAGWMWLNCNRPREQWLYPTDRSLKTAPPPGLRSGQKMAGVTVAGQ